MINLEVPRKLATLVDQARQAAMAFLRPNSRKYDQAEHTYPKELDTLASLLDGLSASGGGAGAGGVRRSGNGSTANMSVVLGTMEMCWGDAGLLLSMPRQGLGNAAIASVASEEQLARYKGKWAAMAITEPDTGSDSGAIRTTARSRVTRIELKTDTQTAYRRNEPIRITVRFRARIEASERLEALLR